MARGSNQDNLCTMDDAAVLRRYARFGDPDAFAVLADRYGGMVKATCLRVLRNEPDAEDAAQETFLRLARHARTIRSNTPAWLHACAVGAAVDLARRSGVRRRHEACAARPESAEGPEPMLWSQIEPLLDAALARLGESDRSLIVARYLAGRTQAELARQAGVSEGTLSRRLGRALDRLRRELAASGLAVAGAGTLAAALTQGATPTASASAMLPIGKIGLAGAATARPAAAIGVAAAAGLLAFGTVLIAVAASKPAAAPLFASAASADDGELGPAPPKGVIGPFEIVSATENTFGDKGVWISDTGIAIHESVTVDTGEPRIARLDIVRTEPLDQTDGGIDWKAALTTRVRSITPPGDETTRYKPGTTYTFRCGFDDAGRMVMEAEDNAVQVGKNEPRFHAVRPPIGWPEYGRIPEDAGPYGIRGPWVEAERIPVRISADEVNFGTSSWNAGRYRVIEWQRVPGHARILAVQAGGRDPRLIGTRFRLLLRRDDNGWEMAYFPPNTGRSDQWPGSFDYSPANPVRVVRFAEDE